MATESNLNDLLNELPVVIQPVNDAETRFRGNLLGRVSEDRLLITTPPDMPLGTGTRIIVRTLQAGKAVGFETTVQELLEEPVPLMFVDMPQGMEILKLRKTDRLNLFMPIDIRYSKGKGDQTDTVMVKGNLLNISGGGCRIFTKNPIAAETTLHLGFTFPGEKRLMNLSGTVIDSFQYQSIHGHRVRFHTSEKHRDELTEVRSWVEQHQVFVDLSD